MGPAGLCIYGEWHYDILSGSDKSQVSWLCQQGCQSCPGHPPLRASCPAGQPPMQVVVVHAVLTLCWPSCRPALQVSALRAALPKGTRQGHTVHQQVALQGARQAPGQGTGCSRVVSCSKPCCAHLSVTATHSSFMAHGCVMWRQMMPCNTSEKDDSLVILQSGGVRAVVSGCRLCMHAMCIPAMSLGWPMCIGCSMQ